MEVKSKMSTSKYYTREEEEEDQTEMALPGFRFHPTDEELVGFYLRRKVEKRPPINIELIKQIDIYKYEPWDLPSMYIYLLKSLISIYLHVSRISEF